jgi:3-methyladenine DNA glycosylase/8-oxoguanine DNA glycosylase
VTPSKDISGPDRDGLCFDRPAALRHLRRADPELGAVMKGLGPFTLEVEPSGTTFTALARAIIYQQLSPKAAATIHGRFCALFGPTCLPEPGLVLALGEEQLRSCGMSRAKTVAVTDLAARALSGELPTLAAARSMPDEEVVTSLSAVRGIGRWSAEMFLIFQLGRPDVLSLGDYGLRRGFGLAFCGGRLPSPAEVAERGEKWRPYRTAASWYMWRAADALA